MAALREIFASYGFSVDDEPLRKLDTRLNVFQQRITAIGNSMQRGLTLYAAGGGFKKLIDLFEEAGDKMLKLSLGAQRVGMSTEDFQRFSAAATAAGMPMDDFISRIAFLRKTMALAAVGAKAPAKEFADLGIKLQKGDKTFKTTSEIMLELAGTMEGLSEPKRIAALVRLFGRGGLTLAPLFAKGAAGLKDMLEVIDKIGGPLDDVLIQGVAKAGKEMKLFGQAFENAFIRSLRRSYPNLTALIDRMTDWTAETGKALQKTRWFENALITLGITAGVLGTILAVTFWPITLAVAAAGALFIAIDEIRGILEGDKNLVEKWFGADAAGAVRQAVLDIGASLKTVSDDMNKLNTEGVDLHDIFLATLGTVKFIVGVTEELIGDLYKLKAFASFSNITPGMLEATKKNREVLAARGASPEILKSRDEEIARLEASLKEKEAENRLADNLIDAAHTLMGYANPMGPNDYVTTSSGQKIELHLPSGATNPMYTRFQMQQANEEFNQRQGAVLPWNMVTQRPGNPEANQFGPVQLSQNITITTTDPNTTVTAGKPTQSRGARAAANNLKTPGVKQ